MYTICITPQEDGTFKVYTETGAQEAAEAAPAAMGAPSAPQPGMAAAPGAPAAPAAPEEGPAEEETGAQIAPTIKEALTLVLEGLKNNGKIPNTNGAAANFAEGFSSGKADSPAQPTGAY
jgi:hypothetical protein